MPITLECARTCQFSHMCGDMFKKGQDVCVTNVQKAAPNADDFVNSGNNIAVKEKGVRVLNIRAGNVSDPY